MLKTSGDCLADPDADFISNRINWSYPLGLSADVSSRRAIVWCDRNLTAAGERELFAVCVRDHAEKFKVIPIVNAVDLSGGPSMSLPMSNSRAAFSIGSTCPTNISEWTTCSAILKPRNGRFDA